MNSIQANMRNILNKIAAPENKVIENPDPKLNRYYTALDKGRQLILEYKALKQAPYNDAKAKNLQNRFNQIATIFDEFSNNYPYDSNNVETSHLLKLMEPTRDDIDNYIAALKYEMIIFQQGYDPRSKIYEQVDPWAKNRPEKKDYDFQYTPTSNNPWES